MIEKIKIKDFDNLQKLLSINIYFFKNIDKTKNIENINNEFSKNFNSEKIEELSYKISETIGTKVLSVSKIDFEPTGASSLTLLEDNINLHLDKSHISIHTYNEVNLKDNLYSFRIDIDLSTCGKTNPLNILNFLIEDLNPDILNIDLLVRGFTVFKDNYIFNNLDLDLEKFLKRKNKIKYKKSKTIIENKHFSQLKLLKRKNKNKTINFIFKNI